MNAMDSGSRPGLAGLRAIVTGGDSGIGLATVRLLPAHGTAHAALDLGPAAAWQPVGDHGDEIRKQERDGAKRRAKERSAEELRRTQSDYQEKLLRKQDEHDTRTRQLKRVNAQLEDAQRKTSSSARPQEGVARQDLFAQEPEGALPGRPDHFDWCREAGGRRHADRADRAPGLRSDPLGM